jgi:hypothetical protein
MGVVGVTCIHTYVREHVRRLRSLLHVGFLVYVRTRVRMTTYIRTYVGFVGSLRRCMCAYVRTCVHSFAQVCSGLGHGLSMLMMCIRTYKRTQSNTRPGPKRASRCPAPDPDAAVDGAFREHDAEKSLGHHLQLDFDNRWSLCANTYVIWLRMHVRPYVLT